MHQLLHLISKLQQEAKAINQRLFIVLDGDRLSCNNLAQQITVSTTQAIVVSVNTLGRKTGNTISNTHARCYLGHDIDLLIYDAYGGFDPDAFGILVGAIRGGGVCILICPRLSEWSTFKDPENERITVYGHKAVDISGFYLERLAGIISCDTNLVFENDSINCRVLPLNTTNASARLTLSTVEQKSIISDILSLIQSNVFRSNMIITADRGRGKSAAMGIAAAKALQQNSKLKFGITAPRRRNTDTFFKHFGSETDLMNIKPTTIDFFSPDALLINLPSLDILFIDEAAAIPLPVLGDIVASFPIIIFSTTVYGYEGAGRGFALRFTTVLRRYKHQSEIRVLTVPIRYAENDPLEIEANKLLMLNAQINEISVDFNAFNNEPTLERLSSRYLLNNESQMAEIYALFVQAHYQTKPLDLRHIMDGANLSCYVIRQNGITLGAVLLAHEGSIYDELLTQQILHGERRPKGHLLPQILSYQHLQPNYLEFRIARIVRIVIRPELQHKGFGSILLKKLEYKLRRQGLDAMGACFGDDDILSTFWEKNGYAVLHRGNRRNASSGLRSAIVLKSFSANATTEQAKSQNRYLRNLGENIGIRYTDKDLDEITSYCLRRRDYAASEKALIRFFSRNSRYLSGLSQKIIIDKVLQSASWKSVCRDHKLRGRSDCESRIKSAAINILKHKNTLSFPEM